MKRVSSDEAQREPRHPPPRPQAPNGGCQGRRAQRRAQSARRLHARAASRLLELLDDELDRAAGALLGDLRRMTHANMSEEVDFFIRALDADLIVPSDF